MSDRTFHVRDELDDHRRRMAQAARISIHQARRCLDYLRDFVEANEGKGRVEAGKELLALHDYLERLTG